MEKSGNFVGCLEKHDACYWNKNKNKKKDRNGNASSSRMCFMSHKWLAMKQRLRPQSVAEISRHSVLSGQDSTMWDIVWVLPQRHKCLRLHTQSMYKTEWWWKGIGAGEEEPTKNYLKWPLLPQKWSGNISWHSEGKPGKRNIISL